MSFEKGNKIGRGGARVGAGRKKVPSTLVKEALQRLDTDTPAIFQKLTEMALAGDVKAAIYLIDRRLGKPIQAVDVDAGLTKKTEQYLAELVKLRGKKQMALKGEAKAPVPIKIIEIVRG